MNLRFILIECIVICLVVANAQLAGECAMLCNDLRGEILANDICRYASYLTQIISYTHGRNRVDQWEGAYVELNDWH